MRRAAWVWIAALVASASPARAQNYFGQNQVQYGAFDWRVKETEHFLVYYYEGENVAAEDAARMAERAYARLSRMLNHQFRDKKPIILYASRPEFGRNNVTGDLGEGTGGVTESTRDRMLLYFTGDYRGVEHVLTHEMVHAFQYDIFEHAPGGIQQMLNAEPPLWFAEGMAEYLSLGPHSVETDTWMRDAALHGHIPSIKQLTDRPDEFFPYRFGHSFWEFIGRKYGDESVGQILNAVAAVGVERGFHRELGESLDALGDAWREDVIKRMLPAAGSQSWPRDFAQPLLTPRTTEGDLFVAPSLSPAGTEVAFLGNGNSARGEVFIDLWLADATTGKKTDRLAEGATTATEEFRVLYSQSAFSPDGWSLAFTAQAGGRDVLYVMDLRNGHRRRIDVPLETITCPSWSPDGSELAVSGGNGGLTDLYIVGVAKKEFRALTSDRFGDLQPQWSPDGRTIAFVTDRGPDADLALLRVPKLHLALFDLATGTVTNVPGQDGQNINPQWSPDSRAIAYVSDRTGTPNVFLYELASSEHYELTDVVGAVSAFTSLSPAISWSRESDKLAFTYFDDGSYTVWAVDHPRLLAKSPYRASARVADVAPASRDGAAPDSASGLSVAALLDSVTLGLPDTSRFTDRPYPTHYAADYVVKPSIGYVPDTYGAAIFGGASVTLSDMVGDHRLAFSAEINGRLTETRAFVGFTNLAHRFQYSFGVSQSPYYFLASDSLQAAGLQGTSLEHQRIDTYVGRQLFGVIAYPFTRFTRVEIGAGYNDVSRYSTFVSRAITNDEVTAPFLLDSIRHAPRLDYGDAQAALVSDNTLFGTTGPIAGTRFRLQVSPVAGSFRWMEYLADIRNYFPIVFDKLTLASRAYADLSVGRDEDAFPKYIARSDFVRGFDRNSTFSLGCPLLGANPTNCSAAQLLGSRVAVWNEELRFPLLRRIELGFGGLSLPPIDALIFHDAGLAWSAGQSVYLSPPTAFDFTHQRYPLRSWGGGFRMNLFDYAIVSLDYAIPLDHAGAKGIWTWSLWPSF